MVRRMTSAYGRFIAAALLSLMTAACQSGAGTTQSIAEGDASPVAAATVQTSAAVAAASVPQEDKRHFIEFRSRYALSYGHSYVIFGRLDEAGNMINPEVAGLAPKSNDPAVYMMGHVAPVPASHGWTDGDLEDEYMSANWRVMLTQAEYNKVVADIRELQASSPVWHAALYNCNAFVGDIARSMGYTKVPFIWVKPQQFITGLRKMNGGPNAIGTTRATVVADAPAALQR